jgi:hypothetical protein
MPFKGITKLKPLFPVEERFFDFYKKIVYNIYRK